MRLSHSAFPVDEQGIQVWHAGMFGHRQRHGISHAVRIANDIVLERQVRYGSRQVVLLCALSGLVRCGRRALPLPCCLRHLRISLRLARRHDHVRRGLARHLSRFRSLRGCRHRCGPRTCWSGDRCLHRRLRLCGGLVCGSLLRSSTHTHRRVAVPHCLGLVYFYAHDKLLVIQVFQCAVDKREVIALYPVLDEFVIGGQHDEAAAERLKMKAREECSQLVGVHFTIAFYLVEDAIPYFVVVQILHCRSNPPSWVDCPPSVAIAL